VRNFEVRKTPRLINEMKLSAGEKPVHTEKHFGLADEMMVSAEEQCRETRRVSSRYEPLCRGTASPYREMKFQSVSL
jgi:hypothetical protein